jgi:hypothetical protein
VQHLPPFDAGVQIRRGRFVNSNPQDPFRDFVALAPSPGRGLGVFALCCSHESGRILGAYHGRIVSRDYPISDYVYYLKGKYVDGAAGIKGQCIHWSSRLNDLPSPQLQVANSGSIKQIRPFHRGQELGIDYGPGFWKGRSKQRSKNAGHFIRPSLLPIAPFFAK